MDSEFSPLNPAFSRNRGKAYYAWWALNIALVVFVFLAFVLAAAAVHNTNSIEHTENSYSTTIYNWELRQTYKVAQHTAEIVEGSVVSYTNNSNEVAMGLGPIWDMPIESPSIGPASTGDIAQLDANTLVYAFSPVSSPTSLSVEIIGTPATGGPVLLMGLQPSLTAVADIRHVHVKALSSTNFVITYTTQNANVSEAIYMVSGIWTASNKAVSVTPFATPLVTKAPPTGVYADMVVIGNSTDPHIYLQIAAGDSGSSAELFYFMPTASGVAAVDLTTPHNLGIFINYPMSSYYLGNGAYVMANASTITVYQIQWTANSISVINSYPLGWHRYQTISLVHVPGHNALVAYGVQEHSTQGPLAMTQIIDFTFGASMFPSLTVHWPVNLITDLVPRVYHDHIRATFLPPTAEQPEGTLLFVYVDSTLNVASLIRGKFASGHNGKFILPSTRVFVSTTPYEPSLKANTWYGQTEGPLIAGPTSAGKAFIMYQSSSAAMDTFSWIGGYRIAGIAASNSKAGHSVTVLRNGLSNVHKNLLTGYEYYANNSGILRPDFSLTELFTPNGWPFQIGHAMSDTTLLLNQDVIEKINSFQ